MTTIDDDLTPEQQAELGDLSGLYDRLSQYDVSEPDTFQLFNTLQPHISPNPIASPTLHDWLRLIQSEAKLFEPHFWLSSLIMTLIGALWGIGNNGDATVLVLLFISPLIAVISVAYIFRPATRTLWELEQFSHYTPVQLLYARMLVILALNIAIAGFLLLTAWTQGLQMILWRLLLIWFGPMIGLMGLALFCSLRWGTVASWVLPLSVWGMTIALGWREALFNLIWSDSPIHDVMILIQTSNSLLWMSGIALISGLLFFYISSRQVTVWDS